MESQATARFAFDAMVLTPVEGRLQQLEAICDGLSECALDNSEPEERSAALQQMIRRKFNAWYFSTDALLQAAPTKKTAELVNLLVELPDEILPLINRLSLALSPADLDAVSAELMSAGTSFVARTRAQMHEARLTY